jgi:hypothetical protein
MRRILLVLAVAALIAAMVMASAVPAFAARQTIAAFCFEPDVGDFHCDLTEGNPTAAKNCNLLARDADTHCVPVRVGPG